MNTLVIVLIAAVLLSAAYVLYGCWLANKWGIDPKAETPAKKFEDGKRQYQVLYVPLLHWHLQSGRRCTYRICQYLATVRICQPVTVRTGRKNHRTCQSLRSRICHIPGKRFTAYHCNSSDGTWPYYCHQFTESLL